MANVKLFKDSHSLYIVNLINTGEQLQYDFALSKSFTVLVGKGVASVGTDSTAATNRTAIGLYRVPPNEKMICSALSGEPVLAVSLFVLSDSTIMQELIPNSSTRNQLQSSSSNLISFDFQNDMVKMTEQYVYNNTIGNSVVTLSDLNTKLLEGLSL